MPAPNNPPPQDEEGAILSPRQLNRWLDVNPVHPLTRTQTYLTLPTFATDAQWKGYSELVGAFNFNALRNFTLPTNYTVPNNPSYILCIAWIDINNVMHRYKLWENVDEVFYFDVPLYTGQLIKKNFRFEIWSVTPSDTEIEFITVGGGGTASVNQIYQNGHNDTWIGLVTTSTELVYNSVGHYWIIVDGLDIWYRVDSDVVLPYFSWTTVVGGVAPTPYSYTLELAAQASTLTFYTSVRGNFDYMWRDDNALALASSIITDFNIANTNAPWTCPVDSVPAPNT